MTLSRRALISCTLLLSLFLANLWGATNARTAFADWQPSPSLSGDLVCGPRCVGYLLKWYGHGDEDLVKLVKEMQWPRLEGGATMASLSKALQARGVHTHALRISRSARLVWDHPVLVHLQSDNAALGHYVVWLPSSRNTAGVQFWNGLHNVSGATRDMFASYRSGAVLLTSPTPIIDAEAAIERDHSRLLWTTTVLGALLFVAAALTCLWFFARRNSSHLPLSGRMCEEHQDFDSLLPR